ncbi:MAG TPA: hypothetical protein VFI15_08705 [Candidatus Limnocylindrales bacterium]|nr:hypothetical protein [Candidatus Limnocylindrales bacterium]
MNVIIGGGSVADNRDASVTARHRTVGAHGEHPRHPATRPGGPTGGLRMPARRTSMRFLGSKLARRATIAASAVALAASIGATGVAAGGPPSLSFYIDDVRYRTVGTPTDFFGTGAPLSTYDSIYNLGTGINVADAKPGDTDFNGGRWLVYTVTWADGVTPIQYTNDQQIWDAQEAGLLTVNTTPVKAFFCNVAVVPGSPSGR